MFIAGFLLGFVVGALIGGLIVALASAADREVPREPVTVRLYSPDERRRGAYRILRIKAGESVAIRGELHEHGLGHGWPTDLGGDAAERAFGGSDDRTR